MLKVFYYFAVCLQAGSQVQLDILIIFVLLFIQYANTDACHFEGYSTEPQ